MEPEVVEGQDAVEDLEGLYTPRGSPVKKSGDKDSLHPWCKAFVQDKLSQSASEISVQVVTYVLERFSLLLISIYSNVFTYVLLN